MGYQDLPFSMPAERESFSLGVGVGIGIEKEDSGSGVRQVMHVGNNYPLVQFQVKNSIHFCPDHRGLSSEATFAEFLFIHILA
jgi:hypothetical protein